MRVWGKCSSAGRDLDVPWTRQGGWVEGVSLFACFRVFQRTLKYGRSNLKCGRSSSHRIVLALRLLLAVGLLLPFVCAPPTVFMLHSSMTERYL